MKQTFLFPYVGWIQGYMLVSHAFIKSAMNIFIGPFKQYLLRFGTTIDT